MAVNRNYSNTAVITTLNGGISNAVTTMVVVSVSGWPGSYPYTLCIDRNTASEELVTVSSAAGLTLTVIRGADSTTAVSHSSGASVEHTVSARDFREPQEHIDAVAAHGAVGAVVGTANVQTITNKVLTDASNQVLPPGVIMQYGGSTAPGGWLLCDGTAVSRVTYAALFAVFSTTYGVGDGSTTFGLPNLKGRTPVGRDAAQTEFDVLGEAGGAKVHTLTTAEMPAHGHSVGASTSSDGNHTHSVNIGVTGVNQSASDVAVRSEYAENGATTSGNGTHGHTVNVTQSNAGSGNSHNNLQPYLVLNHIVKV